MALKKPVSRNLPPAPLCGFPPEGGPAHSTGKAGSSGRLADKALHSAALGVGVAGMASLGGLYGLA